MNESETLARFLCGAADLVEGAPRPESESEAAGVLAPLHQLLTTTEGLHDRLVGCYGPLDGKGRCMDCGRLVDRAKAHDQRGCMMLVPVLGNVLWLLDNPESIPYFGKRLWLRRRAAAPSSAPVAAGTGEGQ